jgi:hypothetical protein
LLDLAPGDAPKVPVDVDGQLRGSSAQNLLFHLHLHHAHLEREAGDAVCATPPLLGALMLDVVASILILRPFFRS